MPDKLADPSIYYTKDWKLTEPDSKDAFWRSGYKSIDGEISHFTELVEKDDTQE